MKKTAALVLGVLLTAGLYAQSAAIAYVDIPTAENEVATLTKENDTLTAENDRLNKENSDLRSKIATSQNTINEVNPIIENVRAKGAELYTIISTISDKKMKDDAQAALNRNKELQGQLENKKAELERSVTADQRTVTNNQRQIDINNAKMQKNKDRIVILNAAIAKTKFQQGQLQSYMQDVDKFLTNAEAVLKK